jgi:predicted GH43/DUF377 family glycosyl hydrolase
MSLQHWRKHDLVFCPSNQAGWICSHAQVPTPIVSRTGLRIYFGARDALNRTSTVFIDLDAQKPGTITKFQGTPVLPLGKLGCFDDAGVMPSSVVTVGRQTFLYYTGWNTSTTVPYRNSIGLAVSDDDGVTFNRPFEGPLLDRVAREPHFCATPFVMRDGSRWRMWYLSCTEWILVQGKPEARYLIRHTESDDGIEWRRPGTIAIDYTRPDEAIARPWVVKDGSGYHMWYSYRSIYDYRQNPKNGYRLGYATSSDGISWKRQDELVNLPASAEGWDSEMIAYPAVIDIRQQRYLLYNGNGFGATGFGIAELSGC